MVRSESVFYFVTIAYQEVKFHVAVFKIHWYIHRDKHMLAFISAVKMVISGTRIQLLGR